MTPKERIEEILKDLIDELYAIDITCNFSEEEQKEADEKYAQATQDIIKMIEEILPRKEHKDKKDCIELRGYKNGYDQAIDDMKERLK